MSAHDLQDVKVGDVVGVSGRTFAIGLDKRTVSRVTKTQVVLDDGSRWLKRGGKVGDHEWSREWAAPWDEEQHQEMVARVTRERLANELRLRSYRNLSLDQLQRIEAIFKEVNP